MGPSKNDVSQGVGGGRRKKLTNSDGGRGRGSTRTDVSDSEPIIL